MRFAATSTFVFLFLWACHSPAPGDHAGYDTLHAPANSYEKDSSSISGDTVAEAYSQAIADFIKAVSQKHHTRFDTLFFGRHVYGQPDDFPDIVLPETIEHTPIRLITPGAGQEKQQQRKSLVYVNLTGWINPEKAEFIFIVFSNGGEHQYDCSINYKYNAARKEFEPGQLRFEYFLYKKP